MTGASRSSAALDPRALPLEGSILIEASAGTGKTYTITTLVLRLLLESELSIDRILVLTFTRAATAELRDRIRRRLTAAQRAFESGRAPAQDEVLARLCNREPSVRRMHVVRLAHALRDFDRAPIFTIHGFCQRVLGEHALESKLPFELSLLEDTTLLVDQAVQDFLASVAHRIDPRVLAALMAQGIASSGLTEVARLVVREPLMPVLPEARLAWSSAIDPEPFAEVARLRAEVADEWRASSREVLELLLKPGVLNQGSFGRQRILDDWVPQLERLNTLTDESLRGCVERLTQEKVRARTNKASKDNIPTHPFFAGCTRLLAAMDAAERAAERAALHAKLELVTQAREHVAAEKARLGLQSFDDILHFLLAALRDRGGELLARSIAARYPALLVDEFQDTDPIQLEVFRRLHEGGGRVFACIGDPKQAIYGFRGADVFAYMAAADALRARGGAALPLGVSFRSDPSLVHALNCLFGTLDDPFCSSTIGYPSIAPAEGARDGLTPASPALEILWVPRPGQEVQEQESQEDADEGEDGGTTKASKGRVARSESVPAYVAREIVRLLGSDSRLEGAAIEPRHIAVLCRTNKQGLELQAMLSGLGVPAALDGDSSVIESDMAEELGRLLRAMAEPSRRSTVCSALATTLIGCTATELLSLRTDDRGFEHWLERFARVSQLWHERGFVQAVHALLAQAQVRSRLLSRPDGERRLTDLLHLIEILHVEAVRDHLGPLALVQRFEAMCAGTQLSGGLSAESMQLRLESDERAVRITTIHRSKGLEYPIVFCPYLWTSPIRGGSLVQFHDPIDAHRMKLDLGSEALAANLALAHAEARAEALRLAYVALTRAKHRVYVLAGAFGSLASSPLAHLLYGARAGKSAGIEPSAKSTDEALRTAIAPLVDASSATIGLRMLEPLGEPERYEWREKAPLALIARRLERELGSGERLTSFSRMTRSASKIEPPEPAHAEPHPLEIVSDEDLDVAPAASETGAERVILHDFPAGAGPGTILHAIYERIDFERADAEQGESSALREEIRRWLTRGRIDAERFAEPVERAIVASLRTPLSTEDPALVLATVASRDRLNELEFTLPVREPRAVSVSSLARIFAQHGAPAASPAYAERLGALSGAALQGFLRGVIDLVFRRGERFYLVDYKSNHLGEHASDYGRVQLVGAMQEHHYFLQYHLYALALHRYLRTRVRGYDFERHFGGVSYAFVRGMAPEHAPGLGTLFDRPSQALIEALDHALGTRGAA